MGRHVRAESKLVSEALGPNALAVHHIGSTAILTIYAKPIVDLLVEVVEIHEVAAHNPAMEELGYEATGVFGISRHHSDTGNLSLVSLFVDKGDS